ncbi:MAG: metalloregulator ArsR/SmtB family transcription factor [Planctomycetota bacterium]
MEVLPLLKLLADDNRLRLLSLLEREELSVQELTRVTGLGQSRVSHHLGQLRQAGVTEDRKEGSFNFSRFRPGAPGSPLSRAMWEQIRVPFRITKIAEEDRARLSAMLEERRAARRAPHDRLAGVWSGVGESLERGSLRSEALAAVAPRGWVVADLGCGAGFLTRLLGERFDRVIGVDHSAAMLEAAQASVPRGAPIEWRQGELESLPIEDAEVDAVFTNLVLHHVVEIDRAVEEIARILRPGGHLVVTDLMPHQEEWMREELAAERLGIPPEVVMEALRGHGFDGIELCAVEDRYRMKSTHGRVARLELFLVRAVRSEN